jgi:hypothetical protein
MSGAGEGGELVWGDLGKYVRVLLLAGTEDAFMPAAVLEEVHGRIPRSKLVSLDAVGQ